MRTARAMVQYGPRDLRMSELPIPQIGDDDALLRVEACGLCGTDVEQYEGLVSHYPIIPGHEIVGTIAEIGGNAADRWGVGIGDRVAVEPVLPCHRCPSCLRGAKQCDRYPGDQYRAYGYRSTSVAPGLWGGYADHLSLHPDAILHRVPDGIDPGLAVLFNPLANAIEWTIETPQPQLGDTVVVLGPGQRGLASVIALRARGIRNIVVSGLTADSHKLKLAEQLGAVPVDVERQNLADVVREVSGSVMASVVVDTTPRATEPLAEALDLVRTGGTIVVAGLKGRPLVGFNPDVLLYKDVTIRPGSAASHHVYGQALEMLATELERVRLLRTHSFALEDAAEALEMMAGLGRSEPWISMVLRP